MSNQKGIIKQFFEFIIRPNYDIKNNDGSVKKTITNLVVLFLFVYFIEFAIAAIRYFLLDTSPEKLSPMFESPEISDLLLAVLIAPFIEELAFRLPLRFSLKNFAIGGTVLFYFLIGKIFDAGYYDIHNKFILRIALSIIFGIIIFLIFNYSNQEKMTKFWKKNFRIIVYVFCFVFAFMHITNYDFTLRNLLLMPVLTLTQLIGAFQLSFVRMKYGFAYSWLLHALGNSPVLLTLFL